MKPQHVRSQIRFLERTYLFEGFQVKMLVSRKWWGHNSRDRRHGNWYGSLATGQSCTVRWLDRSTCVLCRGGGGTNYDGTCYVLRLCNTFDLAPCKLVVNLQQNSTNLINTPQPALLLVNEMDVLKYCIGKSICYSNKQYVWLKSCRWKIHNTRSLVKKRVSQNKTHLTGLWWSKALIW